MTKGPLQTAITAAALACLVLQRVSLLSSFARAGAIESPNEDTIDHLIRRRNGASTSTSQRPLHVQDGERNDATVPGEETTNDSKFYDFADWSNDDKQLLRNLLSRMEGILPDMDMGILHDRYMEVNRQDGPDDQQSPPPPTTSRRRRLMEEVDESAIKDDTGRLLRTTSGDTSTRKKKGQKKKGMDKWDDEATVNWAKRGGDNDKKDDSRKQKKSRDDSRKRKNSSNGKKRSNKKKRQNGDTGDDFYAKVAGKKKVTVSSDDKSRKSRKNKDSRKVDDHDYSDSDDKSNVRKQKKKTNGSRKKKASDNTTNKRIKSSFQPKFDESFRDSEDEVDIFKKKQKKKRDRRLKSSKQTKDEGSSDDEYTSEPTSEPTYEATHEDSLEECPEHYYYDSDDGNYYPDTQYHHSKSSKGAKSSKGSSTTRNKSSKFKSAKRAIRRRELKSGKTQKGSKSSKASKGSSASYDLTPCYPPGHGSDDDFEEYIHSRGDCDDGGNGGNGDGVPCPSVDLRKVCDKYDYDGSFRECLEACEPSFCCIHDALSPPAPNSNYLAPNCNEDVNCAQYSYCYIAWWKLADTIGPAIYLRLEQNDDFFDVEAHEIQGDQTGDPFYQQFMLHHFNDVDEILEAGTDSNGDFKASTVFNDPDFWETNI